MTKKVDDVCNKLEYFVDSDNGVKSRNIFTENYELDKSSTTLIKYMGTDLKLMFT